MTRQGVLIAFEGGDGSGKSTQAKLLAERMGALLTRQAGGTPFGLRLREITLDPESAQLSPRAEALLFMADRAEHVDKVVRPALQSGLSVVSDRWAYSTLVYQGHGRGLDIEELRHTADWAMDGLWPHIVVLLDVPLTTSGERRSKRHAEQDHYELAGEELQREVVHGYRELASADPERWRVVDGSGGVDEVAERIWTVIEPYVERAKLES